MGIGNNFQNIELDTGTPLPGPFINIKRGHVILGPPIKASIMENPYPGYLFYNGLRLIFIVVTYC